jgi:hypothetical protein
MSEFLNPLEMKTVDNTDNGKWELTYQLAYESDLLGKTVVVPAGFKTDLASVPRLPVVYLLTGGTCTEAAVVHDYLYSTHLVGRKTADAVLKEASAVLGVPAWRRNIMWAGVRLFGGSHW